MRFLLFFLFLSGELLAQTTATFEQISFGTKTYLDSAGATGLFTSGNIALRNSYDPAFQSWEGWAISRVKDSLTQGFSNQYGCITGKGVNNSQTYAVGYYFNPAVIDLKGPAAGKGVQGMYINNSTYAYYSMKSGDAFAKRFGGVTGNDPDFFLLTIKAYVNGAFKKDSVNFYLADYRFTDNTKDYLLKDWTFVNLSSLGNVDQLYFYLSSSDNGGFGMNTPAYFCMDNITTLEGSVSSFDLENTQKLSVYPNPTIEDVHVTGKTGPYAIYKIDGTLVKNGILTEQEQSIQLGDMTPGVYALRVGGEVMRLVKIDSF
jgi:Domain of unknown function (DUF4465)/Secretion system C-terminal sorting domain